jgi:capsular polysaccharide export protein
LETAGFVSTSGRTVDARDPHTAAAPARLGTVGVFSPGIARIPHLGAFLGADAVVFPPSRLRRRVDTVVGWGRKANTARARRYAKKVGCPFVALEDGFLRSLDLGVSGEPPLSIVVDDLGIYYDATAPSRLERILDHSGEGDPLEDPALLARARRCMQRIREAGLSKYNHAPALDLGPRQGKRVLVVDQTAGDLSVQLGLPHPGGFPAMLEAALREHPDAEVLVKGHPDVSAGAKAGSFGSLLTRERDRLRVLREPASPMSLLEQVDAVYVVTSLMGFEALVAGKPVTCFGVPFYAGWGLTEDRVEVPRRTRRRSLEQVFAAAYLQYARYVDPETGRRCDIEPILEHLALQRAMADANAGTVVCVGFSAWKRGFLPAFLRSPRGRVAFARDAASVRRRELPADAKLAVWASRDDSDVRRLADERGLPLWRLEDGFLRSVGLGSDLYAPASLVVDPLGIYYDPTRPSELERILQEDEITEAERERAAALRRTIVDHGISKYNVGGGDPVALGRRDGQRVVLVVGQVEDDASIRLGCPGIRRNGELLRAAREAEPAAHILFKPHPDVLSGNRHGEVPARVLRELADEVALDAGLAQCLQAADAVHTLTSLVGFEALLRGIPVVVHGQPFYAGWGLTEDRHPHPRRTRRLSLDELVAGALIRYPRYISRRTGRFTTPETVVAQLHGARAGRGRWAAQVRATWPVRQARKLGNLIRGVTRAP